jgi:hypothetical protein
MMRYAASVSAPRADDSAMMGAAPSSLTTSATAWQTSGLVQAPDSAEGGGATKLGLIITRIPGRIRSARPPAISTARRTPTAIRSRSRPATLTMDTLVMS